MIDGFTGKPSESDPQCILWNSRRLASRNGWGASYRRWRQDVGVTWGGVPGPSGNIFWRLGCQADVSGPLWSGARLGETLLGWQALIGGTGYGAFWLVLGMTSGLAEWLWPSVAAWSLPSVQWLRFPSMNMIYCYRKLLNGVKMCKENLRVYENSFWITLVPKLGLKLSEFIGLVYKKVNL